MSDVISWPLEALKYLRGLYQPKIICPKCGKEATFLHLIQLLDRRKGSPPQKKFQDFVCPNCGAVIARSHEEANKLFKFPSVKAEA